MRYRSDIDGLRAIAVLSVVLYHLGFFPRILRGGFVGVDVFFVISGYLITGILQRDVDAGRLSIREFYDRRVRRIFPALFVVHAFCLIASAILLFPSEANAVGRDVMWSLAFVSNVFFCKATGYFDQTSKSSLLLHTWSLSVEEQFYLLLPLMLLALARVTARVRIGILAVLSLVSLGAAERMVHIEPPRAFYLVHYRASELLMGSLLALGAVPPVKRRFLAEALGVTGIGLILYSAWRIRSATPFPGIWAFWPCLGAVAVLHTGGEVRTVVARVLGTPPFRFIGRISYSLYLWHWPLIALRQARLETTGDLERVETLALSIIAATLSYFFVELPFRKKPYRQTAGRTLQFAALGMAGMAALAVGIPRAVARLHPSPRADAVLAYQKYYAATSTRAGTCFLTTGYDAPTVFQKDVCLGMRPDRKNFLLLGDSHAAHYWPALAALRPDINFLQANASGCSAILGGLGAPRCTRLFDYVFREFLPKHRLDAVILDNRWLTQNVPDVVRTAKYLRYFADRVIVFGPIVEYDQPLPRLLARSILGRDPGLPARHRNAAKRATDLAFAHALQNTGAEYYSVYDAVCPGDECTVWASPDVPMQYDYGHLTLEGAKVVLQRLGPALFR